MKRRWNSKAARCLRKRSSRRSIEESVALLVRDLWSDAVVAGHAQHPIRAPYNPRGLALTLGAAKIRRADLDFAGHLTRDGDELVVEIDRNSELRTRNRFTLAHEVGHLALWREMKVEPAAARRDGASTEEETLCNMIASEILVPVVEIKHWWSTVEPRREPNARSAFILEIARHYAVSIRFAALRFREVCAPSAGIALLRISQARLFWWHGVPGVNEIALQLASKIVPAQTTGAATYTHITKGSTRILPFEWRQLGPDLFLIVINA